MRTWPIASRRAARLCTSGSRLCRGAADGLQQVHQLGNKADVNEIDLLDYLAKDEKTSVIAMYLEDVTKRRQFIERPRHSFGKRTSPCCV